RTVLTSLFGKQEAFFSAVQQVACRNTVKLLKRLRGNEVTIVHMANALRNPAILEEYVAELESTQGQSALTGYFRAEVLGKLADKMQQFALGLRLQVEDLVGNDMLRRIFDGRSGIDLDRHLEGGQVLVVNTALGALGKLGDVFGQFVVMHLQNAVFRRPGNEWTRVPHFLYVDEFPRYLNPDFERLLAIGRSYRCGVVLALQNTSQLLFGESTAFRDVLLGNCRTKVVLNLDDAKDARRFAEEMGEVRVEEERRTVRRFPGLWGWHTDAKQYTEVQRPLFSYTDLQNLAPGTGVVKAVRNGRPQPPVKVEFDLAPPDRRPVPGSARGKEPGELEVVVPERRRGIEVVVPQSESFFPREGGGRR
ncbi:MAG: TraM recognition domain-containing protein, partial [Bacillota bacterium]